MIQSKEKYKSKQQELNLKHRLKNKFIFLQNSMNPDEMREKKERIGKKEKGDAMRHQPPHLPH